MSSIQRVSRRRKTARRGLWFERFMAILALINYILVLFDITYIPLRDFWLHRRVQLLSFQIGPIESEGFTLDLSWLIPNITEVYDPLKGIEAHRDTQQYLLTVNELEQELDTTNLQTLLTSLNSQDVAETLESLREQSEEMIDTNPFQIANKTGTLERIKNKMREHVPTEEQSSKEAFFQFWSRDYLEGNNPERELEFFNEEIKPLIETNYYRPIGETGEFVDYFGLIDFPFFAIFFLEFLARTWFISRRRTEVSWLDAMLWRWYDIFLLIPILRWLRIIPVAIRLDQARIIDLSRIEEQIRQGFVAEIAGDMTQVVGIRIINQVQGSIQNGGIANWLSQQETRRYVDINDINEVAELTRIALQLTVFQVLPKVRPELEALLQHNLRKILSDIPAYQQVQSIPGLETIREQFTARLVTATTQAFYDGITKAMEEDPEGDRLLQLLFERLSEVYGVEMQAQQRLQEVQVLLTALLEEVKINYIESLSEEDLEEILDETRALRKIAQK